MDVDANELVHRSIARLIYEESTRRHWRASKIDPADDPRYLALASKQEITVIDWPAPQLFPFVELNNFNAHCMFCSAVAVRAAYHNSPYHFSIANHCCDKQECLLACVDLLLAYIRFDREVNHRHAIP